MFFRRYLILLKRVLTKYVNLFFIAIIPLMAFLVSRLPEDEVSSNIVCGFYIAESNANMENVSSMLLESDTGFNFERCDSVDALRENVTSGKYDCGYYFAKGFTESFITDMDACQIILYSSPASMFTSVTSEIVFDKLLKVFSPAIASYYLENNSFTGDFYSDKYYSYIEEKYYSYMEGDRVFKITANDTGKYNNTAVVDMFPVHKITGLIIFLSAMFGMLAYMKDDGNGVYNRLPKRGKLGFCILNILANMTPVVIIGYLTLIIYENDCSFIAFIGKMLLYALICLIFSVICKYIFRHYKNMLSAMPVIIICTLVFSPIFINLGEYVKALKWLSYLFPTTYF